MLLALTGSVESYKPSPWNKGLHPQLNIYKNILIIHQEISFYSDPKFSQVDKGS